MGLTNVEPKQQIILTSTRSRHPSAGMATARLGQADLLLRDHDVVWHAMLWTSLDPAAAGPLPEG